MSRHQSSFSFSLWTAQSKVLSLLRGFSAPMWRRATTSHSTGMRRWLTSTHRNIAAKVSRHSCLSIRKLTAPPPLGLGDPVLCPSHPIVLLQTRGFDFLCVCLLFWCILCCLLFLGFLYFCSVFHSVLWYCWLGLLTCKTVSQITSTVLVETLNHAQSINQSINQVIR